MKEGFVLVKKKTVYKVVSDKCRSCVLFRLCGGRVLMQNYCLGFKEDAFAVTKCDK